MQRTCTSCGVTDDGPRHLMWDPAKDPAWTEKHMECCAAEGCPDGSCDKALAAAGGATGDELRRSITGGV